MAINGFAASKTGMGMAAIRPTAAAMADEDAVCRAAVGYKYSNVAAAAAAIIAITSSAVKRNGRLRKVAQQVSWDGKPYNYLA